ncbi:hypothetical protein ABIB81_006562 [Bradyrhizobium sp. I1.7.5]
MKDLFFDYGALISPRFRAAWVFSSGAFTIQPKIPHILICGCAKFRGPPVVSGEGWKDLTHPSPVHAPQMLSEICRRHMPPQPCGALPRRDQHPYTCIRSQIGSRDARLQRHRQSVQKLHGETALITPYNRAIRIQASTWNAQAEGCGHERRVIYLYDRRGISEVADLAPHRTAVDHYLRSIDITSPLVRHDSQSPPLWRAGDTDRRFQAQMRLDHDFIARLRSPARPTPIERHPAAPDPALAALPSPQPFAAAISRAVAPSSDCSNTSRCSPSAAATRGVSRTGVFHGLSLRDVTFWPFTGSWYGCTQGKTI